VQAAPLRQQSHVVSNLQLQFRRPSIDHFGIVFGADSDSKVVGRQAVRWSVLIDAHQMGGQPERIQWIAGQPGEWLFDDPADQVFDARQG
jgi:hypothetical protein